MLVVVLLDYLSAIYNALQLYTNKHHKNTDVILHCLPYYCNMNESQVKNNTEIFFNSDIWGQGQVDNLAYSLATTDGDIEMLINSPGGDVFTGTALAALIEKAVQNGRKIKTTGIGLVASAATFLLLAGSEVSMQEDAFLMVHQPFSYGGGNSDDLRKDADLLDKIEGMIVNIYARKMMQTKGMDEDEAKKKSKKYVQAETWFTAQEALEAGLIDSINKDMQPAQPITESVEANNRTDKKYNYTNHFKNAPLAFKLQLDNQMDNKQVKEAKSLFARLANLFGVSNNAEAETVEETVDATVEETPIVETEKMTAEQMKEALETEGYAVITKEELDANQELLNKLNARLTAIENKQASKNIAAPALATEKKKENKSKLNKEQASMFDLLANAINRK